MKTLKVRPKFETHFDCLYVNNSDTPGLKSGRQVAVRCRNATRRRNSTVKMAVTLAICNLRFSCESLSYIDRRIFYLVKEMNTRNTVLKFVTREKGFMTISGQH